MSNINVGIQFRHGLQTRIFFNSETIRLHTYHLPTLRTKTYFKEVGSDSDLSQKQVPSPDLTQRARVRVGPAGTRTRTRMRRVRVPGTFEGAYKLLFLKSEWLRQKKQGHPIYSPLFGAQSSVFQDSLGIGLVGGGSESKDSPRLSSLDSVHLGRVRPLVFYVHKYSSAPYKS